MSGALECLDGPEGCEGAVEQRSVDGLNFWPRCEHHFELRLDRQEEINERYPEQPPSDFSPLDAGEAWSEDDY